MTKRSEVDLYDDQHIDPSEDEQLESLESLKAKALRYKLSQVSKKKEN